MVSLVLNRDYIENVECFLKISAIVCGLYIEEDDFRKECTNDKY